MLMCVDVFLYVCVRMCVNIRMAGNEEGDWERRLYALTLFLTQYSVLPHLHLLLVLGK